MSEVQSRPAPARGRGSSARGRGGFSGRGRTRGGHATNGDKLNTTTAASIEDEGEVGQLKKQYGDSVTTIKEMFPGWTDEDIVFALQETGGDLLTTVDRISDGTISQWGEVSKTKKDRSRSKVKDATLTDSSNQNPRVSRRGRGSDRGRGGRARGAPAAHTNGSHTKENVDSSVPTAKSTAWDNVNTSGDTPSWDTVGGGDTVGAQPDAPSWDTGAKPAEESSSGWGATAAVASATSSLIPEGVKKSWASIFTKPTPAPAPKAPVEKPVETAKPEEPTELPSVEPEASIPEPALVEPDVSIPAELAPEEPEINITPSKDPLTEDNLEQIPDVSNPPPTATAASTAASSWDPHNVGTPSALHSQPRAVRPPTSGFHASALKATGASGRTSSYQRRVLDQEEAVRMPGNREVDRAAVQFGAFNLNGSGEEDVDGEREEPETRAQPPQHSPVAPRAALPPTPQQPVTAAESFPTPKQSAGLPAASHPPAAPGLPSPPSLPSAQSSSQQGPPGNFNQYGRYGQAGAQEPSSLPQKPYDAFSQQAPSTQSFFEGNPSQQTPAQPQQQSGAFSSAPDQYSSYYTADPQQRNAYNSYYQQQYGLQQGAQGQQEGSAPQRSFSGYNGPQAEGASPFPQSAAQQAPSRYATAGGEGSGHNTPNPASQAQQQGTSQGTQPQQPGHPQQPQAGNYPYGHPYYSSPYYAAYMNQYQQYGGGNYGGGGPYGAKAGLQQPYQGYGMSPAGAPYEHASSPAAGGFGGSALHGRDSALGGGLGDYGRAGSAQSAQTPQGLGGSGAFGGAHDPFARGSYPGQNQQHYNANQNAQAGSGDDLKPFGDSKAPNGPSPSLSQAGRPGSATNAAPGSALPPPQSQQGGYGGYPAHLQQQLHSQSNSYGGLGGAGGHQAAGQGHQGSQYGGGYQGFTAGYGYGNTQQQRGGWGGNYGGH